VPFKNVSGVIVTVPDGVAVTTNVFRSPSIPFANANVVFVELFI